MLSNVCRIQICVYDILYSTDSPQRSIHSRHNRVQNQLRNCDCYPTDNLKRYLNERKWFFNCSLFTTHANILFLIAVWRETSWSRAISTSTKIKKLPLFCNTGKVLQEVFVLLCKWRTYLTLKFDNSKSLDWVYERFVLKCCGNYKDTSLELSYFFF